MRKTVAGHFRKDLSMLCILSLLEQNGEMYGYELVKAMDERSGGAFALPEGTIYPVLYRLEDQGYVQQRTVRVGRRMDRVYYSLTEEGVAFCHALHREYDLVHRGIRHIMAGKEDESASCDANGNIG